jgi:hypothetical protein
MPRPLILVLCSFLFATTLFAEDWPQFRGPSGQGVSKATNLPTKWSATENVAWSVAIPGRGWSSPVIAEGKIYLTTALLERDIPTSLRAICVDAESGKIVWNTEIFHREPVPSLKHDKSTHSNPTPVVTKDRLYVHFGHLGTAALDLAGNVIWRQTTLGFSSVHGNGGSPALFEDLLIFNCDGAGNPFMAALDAKSGDVKWKAPRNSKARMTFSFSTPLVIEVDGKPQVISPASGIVAAYEPASGKEIWRVNYGSGYSVVPRPIYHQGLVLVSSGFDTPVVYAINPKGASGDVTSTHVAWKERKGAPNTPSIVAWEDEVYWVSAGGVATCADVKSGKIHWSERVGGGHSASPVAAEGRVYFQNEKGVGYVVKAGKSYQLLAQNDLEEASLASYGVMDGALIIRTATKLWKISNAK